MPTWTASKPIGGVSQKHGKDVTKKASVERRSFSKMSSQTAPYQFQLSLDNGNIFHMFMVSGITQNAYFKNFTILRQNHLSEHLQ